MLANSLNVADYVRFGLTLRVVDCRSITVAHPVSITLSISYCVCSTCDDYYLAVCLDFAVCLSICNERVTKRKPIA